MIGTLRPRLRSSPGFSVVLTCHPHQSPLHPGSPRNPTKCPSYVHHHARPLLVSRAANLISVSDHAVCRRRHSLSHLPGHRAPIETGTALGAAARRCAGIRSRRDGGDGSLETGQVMSGVTGSPEVFHWNLTRECTVLSANDLHCKVAAVHCLDRLMPEAGETLN